MKRHILGALLGACIALPLAAAGLPDLGDAAANELSPLAERKLGQSIMEDIRWRDPAYLDDPEVEEYLNRLGQRLAAASNNPSLSFDFFAVRDATLNAFALPGGYVGVHTGLILAAQSESELAGVLGHEVAHVTQRHIAQMVARQSQGTMVMLASLLAAALAARSSGDAAQAAVMAGQSYAMESQLGYSRDFEREADRIGVQTLEHAGFDTRGMVSFFERLQRESRLYENKAPVYLRSHPLTTERITDMGHRVDDTRYRQVPDSLDFVLIRAALRAERGNPLDELRDVEAEIAQRGEASTAQQFTLARAALRAGRHDKAHAALEGLRRQGLESPLLASLEAAVLLAEGRGERAVQVLEGARVHWPERVSLRYALLDTRLRAGQAEKAVSEARSHLQERPQDSRLWGLLAQAQAAQGRRGEQHQALGEMYALRGDTVAAIEQLDLARKAGDMDFYALSALDARLRELQQRRREEIRERQGF